MKPDIILSKRFSFSNHNNTSLYLPLYYGIFILAAVFPQVIHIYGGSIDSVWKILVILFLLYKTINLKKISRISKTTFYCLFILSFSYSLTLACNFNSFNYSIDKLVIPFLMVYLFLELPQRVSNIPVDNIFIFHKIFVLFIIFSCIYNMIVNYTALLHITSITPIGAGRIHSFFDNKNSFGAFLFFGNVAAAFLWIYTNDTKWFFSTLIIFLNLWMSMCRTAIVLSLVLLFISYVLVEKKPKWMKVASYLVVLLILFCSIIFYDNIIDLFNNFFSSTRSLDVRDQYIDNMMPLLDGYHGVVGYGTWQANNLAAKYAGNQYFHNSLLKIFISGGLLYFIFYLFVVLVSFKNCISCCFNNWRFGVFNLCVIIAYIIYTFFEAITIFEPPVLSMVATLFVVSFPILFSKCKNKYLEIQFES